jgi:phenylalanyl-tRNA synthetase beta subunit
MPNSVANLWHRVKICDILGKLGNSALYRQPRIVRSWTALLVAAAQLASKKRAENACLQMGMESRQSCLQATVWQVRVPTSTTDRLSHLPDGLEDDTMTITYRNFKRKWLKKHSRASREAISYWLIHIFCCFSLFTMKYCRVEDILWTLFNATLHTDI